MIYVLLALLALLAMLLLLPVGVVLDYSERGRRWFVVWLGLRIPVSGMVKNVFNRLKDDGKEKRGGEEAGERHGFPKVKEMVQAMTSNVRMFKRGLDTIRSISRHIRITVHRLDVVVATPNPALTGFAYGMTQAFGYAFAGSIPWHSEPEFLLEKPSLSFRVEVSATPIKVLPAMLRFLRFMAKRRVARFRQWRRETS